MADEDKSEETLNRADALLRRHRPNKTPAEIPVLTDALNAPNIPTLTEKVEQVETPAPSAQADVSLEASIYLKLKQELDRELRAGALPPEAVMALDKALHRVSAGVQDDVQRLVRATIEQVLQERTASTGIMPGFPDTPKTK